VKHFYNQIIIVTLFFALASAGCGGGSLVTRWRGPAGSGERNPFETSISSTDEYRECLANSRELRQELLRLAGLGEACEDCDDTVAAPARTIARTACMGRPEEERDACVASLLEHVSPDTELTLGGTRRASASASDDPFVRQIRMMVAMNPAVYRDDVGFCATWASTYGVPGGGMGGMMPVGGVPVGSVGGTVPGLSVGFLGSTVGGPGVSGFGSAPVRCIPSSTVSCYAFDTTGNPFAVRVIMTPEGGVGAGSTFIVQPGSILSVPVSRAIRYHVARQCEDPATGLVTARLPDTTVDPARAAFPMALTQPICAAHRL
jgi:hypothetical protein